MQVVPFEAQRGRYGDGEAGGRHRVLLPGDRKGGENHHREDSSGLLLTLRGRMRERRGEVEGLAVPGFYMSGLEKKFPDVSGWCGRLFCLRVWMGCWLKDIAALANRIEVAPTSGSWSQRGDGNPSPTVVQDEFVEGASFRATTYPRAAAEATIPSSRRQ